MTAARANQSDAVEDRRAEELAEPAPDHRKRSARQARHAAKTKLHQLAADEDGLDDADLLCPQPVHDLGRRSSSRRRDQAKPGRRGGFKVWKTTFWKRRRNLWHERNAAERALASGD